MKNLENLIETIKTGTRFEVKQAQKAIEVYLRDFRDASSKERDESAEIFLKEIENLSLVRDTDHQCYFINVLKWPFFYFGNEYFEEFKDFILLYIQHPSGKIRQSVISAADWLVMSLHLSFIFYPKRKPTGAEKRRVKEDRLKFCRLVDRAGELSNKYYMPKYGRIKYVSSLPVSEYKSIQKLLTEVLLSSDGMERIYDDYRRAIDIDDSINDIEVMLPAIELKYLKHEIDGEVITYPDVVCSACGAKDIPIGATKYAFSKNPEVICEDCAIDEYQTRYGFVSRDIAAARRRRIFDVGYLLQEMMIDKYLEQNEIDDYSKLDIETMSFIGDFARRIYNENFTKEEKWALENEPDQKKIMECLRGKFSDEV